MSSEQRSDFIQYQTTRLSQEIAEGTGALTQACDALAACDLLASYGTDEFIGSNGNVSCRAAGGGFVITATQLAAKAGLTPADFVRVTNCSGDSDRFTMEFHGPCLPSSESLMHWHLYRQFPDITAIVHVHEANDRLFADRHRWEDLAVVETPRSGATGTMALGEVAAEAFTSSSRYVILKDHRPDWDLERTGTVVLGRTLAEAVGRALHVHDQLAP